MPRLLRWSSAPAMRLAPLASLVLFHLSMAGLGIALVVVLARFALLADRAQLVTVVAVLAGLGICGLAGHSFWVATRAHRILPMAPEPEPVPTVTVVSALGEEVAAEEFDEQVNAQVARHEAAHAVVAHHYGCRLAELSINGLGGGLTSYYPACVLEDTGNTDLARSLRRGAVISAAGWLLDAEAPNDGSCTDWSRVTENGYRLISLGAESTFDRYVTGVLAEARTILEANQEPLERLATRLHDAGRLDGEEAEALLAG